MAFLRGFGCALPERVVSNEEIAARVGKTADWIRDVSGIGERRWASESESVTDLAVRAAQDCLARCGAAAPEVGMILVASGSSPRRFPGPASSVGVALGMPGVPALDVPIASAGAIFGLSLASRLVAGAYKNILVVAAEKMSSVIQAAEPNPNIDILFGDGAGACLVSADSGPHLIVDSVLHSDGSAAEALKLPLEGPMVMDGAVVIRHASTKIPSGIAEILERNGRTAAQIDQFVMHQANQNLIVRVAKALGVESSLFYSNIARYGNTSSASMLIAAAEAPLAEKQTVCFAGFGAGFHWGALLAERV